MTTAPDPWTFTPRNAAEAAGLCVLLFQSAYGHRFPIEDLTAITWREVLADVDPRRAIQAARAHVKSGAEFPPTPGEIRKAAIPRIAASGPIAGFDRIRDRRQLLDAPVRADHAERLRKIREEMFGSTDAKPAPSKLSSNIATGAATVILGLFAGFQLGHLSAVRAIRSDAFRVAREVHEALSNDAMLELALCAIEYPNQNQK